MLLHRVAGPAYTQALVDTHAQCMRSLAVDREVVQRRKVVKEAPDALVQVCCYVVICAHWYSHDGHALRDDRDAVACCLVVQLL